MCIQNITIVFTHLESLMNCTKREMREEEDDVEEELINHQSL